MLQMLAEIYASFPEEGDVEQPKLCIFIDEAHLVFQEASSVLLQQIETIVKLIRSKGVGVYFITQNPADVPRKRAGATRPENTALAARLHGKRPQSHQTGG
jgi:DNA helicase HerA-like ATPase